MLGKAFGLGTKPKFGLQPILTCMSPHFGNVGIHRSNLTFKFPRHFAFTLICLICTSTCIECNDNLLGRHLDTYISSQF